MCQFELLHQLHAHDVLGDPYLLLQRQLTWEHLHYLWLCNVGRSAAWGVVVQVNTDTAACFNSNMLVHIHN